MRIIGGEFSGRQFDQPATTATRPMSEKLRAAVFDILGAIEGMTVLDAYSGSGAMGFEALSRGASRAVAVEQSTKVARMIAQSAAGLGQATKHRVVAKSVEQWQYQNPDQKFNVIFADPPYELLQVATLSRLGKHLVDGGILMVSHTSKISPPELQSLSLIKSRKYGDSALSFYRRPLS